MGTTFIASSGDVGVAWRTLDASAIQCLVNGTLETSSSGSFVAAFPASCPYVTAVGATQVSPGKSVRCPSLAPANVSSKSPFFKVHDVETASFIFQSGGGFSNVFRRPHFQQAAVSRYLKRFAPYYGPDVFNRSGRAIPDVSANGYVSFSISGLNVSKPFARS